MDTKDREKLTEAVRMIGELLSLVLPGCDVVLLARHDGNEIVFAITNTDTEACGEIVEKYMRQYKTWEIKGDPTETTH